MTMSLLVNKTGLFIAIVPSWQKFPGIPKFRYTELILGKHCCNLVEVEL